MALRFILAIHFSPKVIRAIENRFRSTLFFIMRVLSFCTNWIGVEQCVTTAVLQLWRCWHSEAINLRTLYVYIILNVATYSYSVYKSRIRRKNFVNFRPCKWHLHSSVIMKKKVREKKTDRLYILRKSFFFIPLHEETHLCKRFYLLKIVSMMLIWLGWIHWKNVHPKLRWQQGRVAQTYMSYFIIIKYLIILILFSVNASHRTSSVLFYNE